jgi:hypothetical protein
VSHWRARNPAGIWIFVFPNEIVLFLVMLLQSAIAHGYHFCSAESVCAGNAA